ncbi:MAG: NAD(P)H-dependent oxidoreductase [Desulfarculus sp.]|nr:NAD(P)H-dependent oxidoreductase [Desulfarculus sp.]
MPILLLLAHPRPGSFNAAIAATCRQTLTDLGHQVVFHDLCAEGFDPVLPAAELHRSANLPELIEQHCAELTACHGLVVVHPNWWGMPPASLVGWVDRVLRPGVAYEFLPGDSGAGVPLGLLGGKTLLVLNTADTPARREADYFGDPLDWIWRRCVAGFCGMARVERRTFSVVVTSTPAERAAWLDQARRVVADLFPARPTAPAAIPA